jgi:peptidoglycan/LPS O-acetylase OafA/YrhL
MLMFYALFPLLFNAERPWLTAIILAVIANLIVIIDPFKLQDTWLHRLHTNAFSLGMVLAWLLSSKRNLVTKFTALRNESDGIARTVIISVMVLFAGYMMVYNSSNDWPILSQLLSNLGIKGYFIDQITSLLAMLALIVAFSLKKLDNKFLYLFGVYSYETYLVHWPLMSRYDVFFHNLPAWLAVFLWLLTFLGIGWLLQKITPPLGVWIDSKW